MDGSNYRGKVNIIPVMLDGFDFSHTLIKNALTGKLKALTEYNGLIVPFGYEHSALEKLTNEFLDKEIEEILLPDLEADIIAESASKTEQAKQEAEVKDTQLSAQYLFEQAFEKQQNYAFSEALNIYQQSLEIDPDQYLVHYNIGVMATQLSQYEAAERAYKKAIELNPSDSISYTNYAVLCREQLRDISKAESLLNKAIELDDANPAAYNNLGTLVLDEYKDPKQAESLFKKAIEIEPNIAISYCNLGLALKAMNLTEEAKNAYDQAIGIDPTYYAAHYNKGLLLQNIEKNLLEAEQSYKEAIKSNPNHAKSYNNLGYVIQQRTNNFAEAESNYRKAIELDPSLEVAYGNLITVLTIQGKPHDIPGLLRKLTEIRDSK